MRANRDRDFPKPAFASVLTEGGDVAEFEWRMARAEYKAWRDYKVELQTLADMEEYGGE